jgi:DNA-binding LacI/PurR family transcriptional regulator
MTRLVFRREPVYLQLAKHLRDSAREGKFVAGRLPSFRELMRGYDVALVTVRKALEVLESEGVIERVQGSGTFVRGSRAKGKRRRTLTRTICYVSGTRSENLPGNFFARMMLAAQQAAERAGYSQIIAVPENEMLPIAIGRGQADGILLAGTWTGLGPGHFPRNVQEVNEHYVAGLLDGGVPLVAVSNHTANPAVHRVLPDYDLAMAVAFERLFGLGHRRIALVGGPSHWPPFAARQEAFKQQLARYGLSDTDCPIGAYSRLDYQAPDAAVKTVADLFSRGLPPTAIVLMSGSVDLVLKGIAAAGRRVPTDVSVATFADDAILKSTGATHPPSEPADSVAAVVLPTEQLGKAAVQRLIELIEGRTSHDGERTLLLPIAWREGISLAQAKA